MADETETSKKRAMDVEEKKGMNKMKLAGVGLAVLGIVVFAAMALFYAPFWDLFIKGIMFMIAVGAICLVLLGILLGVYT